METRDYISCRPDKDEGSRRREVVIESIRQGFVRQTSFGQVNHSGREDARGPGRNEMILRQSPMVSCYK
jgi:hypothetical protein